MSVILGLYFSAELETGSGSMIALVAALIFVLVAIVQQLARNVISPSDNVN
jgi:ABC-type Mn2+/Zn2+ transport system permease subunit